MHPTRLPHRSASTRLEALASTVASALVATLLFASPSFAQEAAPETAPETARTITATVVRATSEIRVDAILDEQAWADAPVVTLDYEWFPGDNVTPPVRTEALVTYDDDNVYFAFRAFDPEPSAIRAHLMDRDTINTFVQDDHIGFMIDPFDDERRAFQFRVNPLGVQADAIFSEVEFVEDFSWDIIWDTAGRITDEGYIVEVALPLDQIRFPKSDGPQVWGIEFSRSYPRDRRHRISANKRDRDRACILCQVDKFDGFEGIEPGRNLEVTPTITGIRTEAIDAFPNGDFETLDEDGEVGVSVRWGVTQAVTLNATYNPDFSQVEADAAQLDVNERFALFFEEKRPFFLEGVDFFSTPINAVFTRTVVDPEFGLKLSGKVGANAGGVFATRDEVNSLLFPSNQGSRGTLLRQDVDGAVVRYRRDIGRGGALGFLATNREAEGYSNRVAGVDGFLRFGALDEIRFQYLTSDTEYPFEIAQAFGQPTGSFDGDALQIGYQRNGRIWQASLLYRDLDPEFRADFGFVPKVDVQSWLGSLTRSFWAGEGDWYDRIDAYMTFERTDDHDGVSTDEVTRLGANLFGPLQSFVQVEVLEDSRFVRGVTYEDMGRASFFGQFQPSAAAKVSLFVEQGETVDFVNNQPAEILFVNPSLELKLGRHLNTQLAYLQQTLDADPRDGATARGEILDVGLTELKVVWNFSLRSFVRAIFQYQDLTRDPALAAGPVEENVEQLFTQLLFSYKLNPQTVLFLGYSDNSLGLQDDRLPLDISLTQTDRTFFFKVGYAFTW